jgi:Tfp pilus assembly protein PilX
MRRASAEQGFVLVSGIILLTVMMGLGLGLLLFTDSQQKASSREQASESAFNVAEAALNAQIGQLNHAWPTKAGEMPARCTAAASTGTNGCPTAESMSVGYPNISPLSCPASTPNDAWGSPSANQWTTYVRQAEPATSSYFNSTAEQPLQPYDGASPPSGKLWVRAVGIAQCRMVVLTSLVTQQYRAANYPTNAVTANWFETSNEGNKTIVNTEGEAGQSGAVSMRCNGLSEAECKRYNKEKEQVSPDTTNAPPSPSQTFSASDLAALKQQAKQINRYYPTGKCPANLSELSGLPAYVEGPCTLSYIEGEANSAKSPGFLVLQNGTIELNGNAVFRGSIYAVNEQGASTAVITIHGNSHVYGSVNVDGNGGISFGSSKENFVYNSQVIKEIKILVGASPNRDSFRVLPNSQ